MHWWIRSGGVGGHNGSLSNCYHSFPSCPGRHGWLHPGVRLPAWAENMRFLREEDTESHYFPELSNSWKGHHCRGHICLAGCFCELIQWLLVVLQQCRNHRRSEVLPWPSFHLQHHHPILPSNPCCGQPPEACASVQRQWVRIRPEWDHQHWVASTGCGLVTGEQAGGGHDERGCGRI